MRCRSSDRSGAMVAMDAASRGESGQTMVVDLPYPTEAGAPPFTRADVVFAGVDHSTLSYEVRLFFNNPAATADTARTADEGYAGRFTVFGHGGWYDDEGHFELPAPSLDPTHLRPAHPRHPPDTYRTGTHALAPLR